MSSIAKNTSYFTFALILQKVVSFSYFAILARNLDPEFLGAYYTAISLATIFSIFVDLGLTNVLTREIAKNQDEAGKYLGLVMAIKLPLALISTLILVFAVNFLGYSPLIKNLVYILVFTTVLDPFVSTFYAVSRGFHNLKYESIAVVIYQLIVLAIGLFSLKIGLPLEYLALALSSASFFNFIYSMFLIKYKLKIGIKPIYDYVLIKQILVISIPFAVFAVAQRLYVYLDTVFLSVLAGEKYVGFYQIAFKIVFALQFLPMAFVASLYPAFSTYWQKDRAQLNISFSRSINYLVIISLPISFGVIILADKIIAIFKPEYIDAVFSLQVIMFSLPFIFLNFPIGSLLNACDKQKANTRNMLIALTVSIIANIILIPKFNSLGASITVLFTNFIMFVLGVRDASKLVVDYKVGENVKVFLKSLISVAIMTAMVFHLKNSINIFANVFIAGIAYFFILYLFRGFKKEDIVSILSSFKLK